MALFAELGGGTGGVWWTLKGSILQPPSFFGYGFFRVWLQNKNPRCPWHGDGGAGKREQTRPAVFGPVAEMKIFACSPLVFRVGMFLWTLRIPTWVWLKI